MILNDQSLTLNLASLNCRAMSLHFPPRALVGKNLSEYQFRDGTFAYDPAGVACCTLVVVITPVDFPEQIFNIKYSLTSKDINGVSKWGLIFYYVLQNK